MRELGVNLVRQRRSYAITLTLIPLILVAAPVQAQDFLGVFRLLFAPTARAPAYPPLNYGGAPYHERRVMPRRAARSEEPARKAPIKPRPLGELSNPVPELLEDKTLRPGDIVMFPDGLRVFTGRAGSRHAMADFEPMSRSLNRVHPTTRKLVANLRPGWAGAWSAEKKPATGVLAANGGDVETTGSLPGQRRW